jgi:outer membrane protein OmpA-like peptidoglycan-associated protein
LEPETVNQYQDEDGCPDQRPTATVQATQIQINERLFFDFDLATLQARSYPILDEVVRVLREHPELRRIRIEGHTDEQGTAEHNATLSRDRARTVRRYLIDHGIDHRRLTARGYGSTRPAVEGSTEEAHAQNRRVLFMIERGPGGSPAELTVPRP